MGLTLEDVRGAIGQSTSNAPKGSLDGTAPALTVLDATDQLIRCRGVQRLADRRLSQRRADPAVATSARPSMRRRTPRRRPG